MSAASGVTKTLEIFTKSFNRGDFNAMESLFASTGDVLGIGSDPTEWWSGRKQLMSVIEVQLKELAGATFEIEDTVSSDRWVAAKCAIAMPDGNKVPARLTVVTTSDGKIEHFHLSVGVANEDLLGHRLTT